MPSVKHVRSRCGGWCQAEFAHPGEINPCDIVRVTTFFPSDENVRDFGVRALQRFRECEWCVLRDEVQEAQRPVRGLLAFRDKHGDIWQFGPDGLMHTKETAPFPFERVKRKWGPLRVVPAAPSTGTEGGDRG